MWLEAAKQATAHAKRKAEAYAAGVDAELGRLLSITEPDEHRFSGKLVPVAARAAAPGPDMHVEVGNQEITTSVWAEFELRVRSAESD